MSPYPAAHMSACLPCWLPQGVIPDIVTMAKGIGNGLPLGAVVTTPEIAATLNRRIHFNTYGGNPVCAAGGRAVRPPRVHMKSCTPLPLAFGAPHSFETPSTTCAKSPGGKACCSCLCL